MPSEARASTAYFVCSILVRCLSFITLPIFARILTKVEYGQATIFESWMSLLTVFITLYLGYGTFNTAMVKFEDDRDRYLAAINGVVFMLGALFVVIYLPLQDVLNPLFELPTWIMLVMVLQIVGANSLQCWYSRERFENHYRRVVFVTLFVAITTVISTLLFVFLSSEEKGYARIFGGSLPTILIGVALAIAYCVRKRTFFDKTFWKFALGFNIPLVPYYLSQMAFNQSDRIMISHMLGTADAATYGVAYHLAMILTFVLSAINGSYGPWLFKRIKSGDVKENRTVSAGISAVLAVLLLCLIAAAPEIIYVLASERYVEAKWVVAPVAMSLLLNFYTQLFVNYQFYYEERWLLVLGSVLAGVVNIALNWLLLPIFGYVVAGYTTLISFFLMALMNWVMYRIVIRKHGVADEAFSYKALIGILVGLFVFGFALVALYDYPVIRFASIAVVFVVAIVKRDWIKSLLHSFRGDDSK